MAGSILSPSSCQHQHIFSRISKLSRSKNMKNNDVRTNTYFLYPCPNNNVHTGLVLLWYVVGHNCNSDCVILKRHTPWFYSTLKYNPYFFVFAFTDFIAWNATVGVDGEWRKLVYRQSPSMPIGHLEKIEISKRIFILRGKQQKNRVFCFISWKKRTFVAW